MKKIDFPISLFASIFVVLVVIIIAFSIVEYISNKSNTEYLLKSKAQIFSETIIHSSQNTILANDILEEEIAQRLLDNAYFINILDSLGVLEENELIQIAENNKIFRINIFNKSGIRVLSNRGRGGLGLHQAQAPGDQVSDFLKNSEQKQILGFKKSRFSYQDRYAVILRRYDGGAIVSVIDAENILSLRKQIGFGKLIQEVGKVPGINYIAFQDLDGLIAATPNVSELKRIESESFLKDSYYQDDIKFRYIEWENDKIMEAVHPLKLQDKTIGLFRIGLSMKEIELLKSRMLKRIIIQSIFLLVVGMIIINYSTLRIQRKKLIEQYSQLESDTSVVLENMAEGIIAVDKDKEISIFNKQSAKMFDIQLSDVLKRDYSKLDTQCVKIIDDVFKNNINYSSKEIECIHKNNINIFSVNTSIIKDNEGNPKKVITAWTDITEKKNLEEHIKRQEHINKMGELASTVAHEIRNPLNAINVIVQRIRKEFQPRDENDEYQQLMKTVRSEINRINQIVTSFLKFAKPLQIKMKKVRFKDFVDEIILLIENQVIVKKLNFINKGVDDAVLNLDEQQMKQVFLNLFQNSIDATKPRGEISFSGKVRNNDYIITISDTGCGIPEDILPKIFDLYYSTKPNGTGLGLSIVHQIITQHNGVIDARSEFNKGTTFEIKLKIFKGSSNEKN